MKLSLRQLVQVSVSLVFALGIFWFLYKDINLEQIKLALAQTSFLWISLSILVSIFGYWLRAWRWAKLIEAGENIGLKTSHSFFALMSGYLANLLLPRAGELTRCVILKRTDNIQVGTSIGTVVLERTIDFLCMLVTVAFAFLLERTIFMDMLGSLIAFDSLIEITSSYLPVLAVVVISGLALLYIIYRQYLYKRKSAFLPIRQFVRQFVRGIKSVSVLQRPFGFWLSSISIWVIYYLMMYFVARGVPSTTSLSASSVLMVMVMGSIGMVAPVQGGIGTFHALVAFILLFYGVAETEGKIFAVIVHGSQVLTIVLLGIISLVVSAKLIWKRKPKIG